MLSAVTQMGAEAVCGTWPVYECKEMRTDYANGYKPTTIQTRVRELEVAIPQIRSNRIVWKMK